MFQVLYTNHECFKKITSLNDLITFRIISIYKNENPIIVSAMFEIPLESYQKKYGIFPINIENGRVVAHDNFKYPLEKFKDINCEELMNFEIPFWENICTHIKNAHHLIPDVYSIGWDVAITMDGIRLIEGNYNWGVTNHQLYNPTFMEYFKL